MIAKLQTQFKTLRAANSHYQYQAKTWKELGVFLETAARLERQWKRDQKQLAKEQLAK
jgi:hypothetical protein